jgi:hypothetical protein
MLVRADYKKLRRWLINQIKQQLDDNVPFVAITLRWAQSAAAMQGIRCYPPSNWPVVWERMARDCGLVDDGTNTTTMTRPEDVEKIQRAVAGYRR